MTVPIIGGQQVYVLSHQSPSCAVSCGHKTRHGDPAVLILRLVGPELRVALSEKAAALGTCPARRLALGRRQLLRRQQGPHQVR